MMSFFCQLIILIILLVIGCFYIIIGIKKYLEEKKKKKERLTVNIEKIIFSDFIIWILITGIFVLATNIIFFHCSETFWVVESLLDYKDTQLMIFSLIPTIAIAYFQYKLQKKSDKEQEIKDKWHKEELIYERIKDIYSKLYLSGFAVNLNVTNSIGRYSEYKAKEKILYFTWKSNHFLMPTINLLNFIQDIFELN